MRCIRGDYVEAEALVRRALAMRIRLLGEEHPDVEDGHESLAAVLRATGRYVEAEQEIRGAQEITGSTFKDEHPYSASVLVWLGGLHRDQSDLAAAESHLRRALALYGERLQPDHPHVGSTKNELAWVRLIRRIMSRQSHSFSRPGRFTGLAWVRNTLALGVRPLG